MIKNQHFLFGVVGRNIVTTNHIRSRIMKIRRGDTHQGTNNTLKVGQLLSIKELITICFTWDQTASSDINEMNASLTCCVAVLLSVNFRVYVKFHA